MRLHLGAAGGELMAVAHVMHECYICGREQGLQAKSHGVWMCPRCDRSNFPPDPRATPPMAQPAPDYTIVELECPAPGSVSCQGACTIHGCNQWHCACPITIQRW